MSSRPASRRVAAAAALLAVAGFASPFAAPLAAQQRLASDTARLGPLTVTATGVPVAAGATGASITVIGGAELRERGIVRVIDALRDVPGAAVVQQSANGSLTSLFLRGGESRYVKVLVDGVPLNEIGGLFDFAQLSTDNVERIEVVRGPASVLWGSDAVAGVINVITRQGADRLRVEASVRTGTTGAEANPPFAPGFTPSVSGTWDADVAARGAAGVLRWTAGVAQHQSEGLFPFNNVWRNTTGSFGLRTRDGAPVDARFTARVISSRFETPTDFSGAVTDSNAFRTEQRVILGLQLGRQLTSRFHGRVSLQANELRARNEDRRDSPGDTLGFISENDQAAFRRLADARLVTALAEGTQLTTGIELQHAGERNDGSSQFATFPVTPSTFDETRTNRAAYANLFAQPVTTVAVNAGARLDDNSAFGRFGTGRVGVTWEPLYDLRLRGAWGTAYREPNFNETFSTTFSTGNPDLAPEQVRTWELGANYAVFGLLQLGATWFDQRFRDLIQFVASTPPAPNYENLASAAARGLELTWGLDRETSRIIFNGSYTLLTTEVLEAGTGSAGTPGQELLRRPARQATVNVGWRAPSVATVQLTTQFIGARRDRDFRPFPAVDVTLPSFWRHDLSVDVPLFERDGAGRLPGLTLRVENLGDVRFENVVGFRAPGRVVLVGIRHGFGG